MSTNTWSSKLSFIITTSAFAIGLGNVWRFPYVAGEGGGAAFLLVYVLLMIGIGVPLLIVEVALGRMSGTTVLLGFGILGKRRPWNGIGWLGSLSCFLIMGFYVMIMAWIVIYLWECISGKITSLGINSLSSHFNLVASSMTKVILVILGIMFLALLVVKQGLKAGLERYSKGMMLGLIFLVVGLSIWAATLDGAMEGYRWLLSPDFSKINFQVIMSALGQLFFSIGVGMAVAFVFGSYTHEQENLIGSTFYIVIADTFFAFLSGLMLFPAIFSFGLEPDSGPNLIFVTMASVFNSLEYGSVVGGIFFLLLFLAGFTSLISSIQGLKDSLQDKFKLTSLTALLLVTGLITLISIPVVLSYNDDPLLFFGRTVFETLDYLTSTILLPLGGLLTILFAGYVVGFGRLSSHLEKGDNKIRIKRYWKPILMLVLPLSLVFILINGILKNT
ncbi:sodium-dependent transporter [Flagellimonas meridianipacifica]|uniref:NSS family neurotransmitter:Na+ symporter n=1 Tax=Flagellimonas meridianipacifica TaxID=1080225 RepID=A0A2T0MBR7_9FLAO|nr:sodium-dependent transporter [Allomuricauda pacifica]PRX54926.1 NSS family neurotransmitter:Na+ symporter [Allomuricauda pacifica]